MDSEIGRESSPQVHILNYGMGVDSTAILLSWIFEPELRPAPLDRVLLVSAQTGNEFGSTKRLVEKNILPLLRENGIRYVQVARHGPIEGDGYTILDDTRSPEELHTEGDFTLGRELIENGTVPAYSSVHHCAQKYKGFPIDSFIREYFSDYAVTQYLGYSAEETKRAEKCEEYTTKRQVQYRFPLIELGWDRAVCEKYIVDRLGVPFLKSACEFCPFVQRSSVVERFRAETEAAAHALLLEWIALALNSRMHLFPYGSAYDLCLASGNDTALRLFETYMKEMEWAVYRVERIWVRRTSRGAGKPFTRVARRVVRIQRGLREAMEDLLRTLAAEGEGQLEESGRILRVVSERRDELQDESCEGFWVAAPATVQDKVRNARAFQESWDRINGITQQLALF